MSTHKYTDIHMKGARGSVMERNGMEREIERERERERERKREREAEKANQ
jgi:hypothetical protein